MRSRYLRHIVPKIPPAECAFHLEYETRWILSMVSPLLIGCIVAVLIPLIALLRPVKDKFAHVFSWIATLVFGALFGSMLGNAVHTWYGTWEGHARFNSREDDPVGAIIGAIVAVVFVVTQCPLRKWISKYDVCKCCRPFEEKLVVIEEPEEPHFFADMEPTLATQFRRHLKLFVIYSYTEPTQEQRQLIGPDSEFHLSWADVDKAIAYQQRAMEFEEDYRRTEVAQEPSGRQGLCAAWLSNAAGMCCCGRRATAKTEAIHSSLLNGHNYTSADGGSSARRSVRLSIADSKKYSHSSAKRSIVVARDAVRYQPPPRTPLEPSDNSWCGGSCAGRWCASLRTHDDQWQKWFQSTGRVVLIYLMIGYVFLAKTALEPLSCRTQLNGHSYITTAAAADIECSWCNTEADKLRIMSYRTLASFAVVAYTIYGFGTPVLFWLILWTNREGLYSNRFMTGYGFLSSKMREEYYWWEVIISIRKLILVSLVMWSPGECKHGALLTWVRAGSEIRCG